MSALDKELATLATTAGVDPGVLRGAAKAVTAEELIEALRKAPGVATAALKRAGEGHWLPALIAGRGARRLPSPASYPASARVALAEGRALGGTDADVIVAWKGGVYHAHPEGFWTLGKTAVELAKHFNRHAAARAKAAGAAAATQKAAAKAKAAGSVAPGTAAGAAGLSPELAAALQKARPSAAQLELPGVTAWPDLAKYKAVKRLIVRGPALAEVGDLRPHAQLGELELLYVGLTALPPSLAALPALRRVSVSQAPKLTDLSALAACTGLELVRLSTIAATALDLSRSPRLGFLYLSALPLTSLVVGDQLQRASFAGTKLADFGFLARQTRLVDLDLSDLKLTELPAALEGLPLQRLVLKGTRIKKLPAWLSKATKVER